MNTLRHYVRQLLIEQIKMSDLRNPYQFHGDRWKKSLAQIDGPDLSAYDGKPVSDDETEYVENWIEERGLEGANDWVAFSRGSASLMSTITDCHEDKEYCRAFDRRDRFIFIAPAAMRPQWQAEDLITRLPSNQIIVYAHECDGAVSLKQVAQFAQKIGVDKIFVYANRPGKTDVTKIGQQFTSSDGSKKTIQAGKLGIFAHIEAWKRFTGNTNHDYQLPVSDAVQSDLPDWGGTQAESRTQEELLKQIKVGRELAGYQPLI